jgi:hypothetical protein
VICLARCNITLQLSNLHLHLRFELFKLIGSALGSVKLASTILKLKLTLLDLVQLVLDQLPGLSYHAQQLIHLVVSRCQRGKPQFAYLLQQTLLNALSLPYLI